MSTRHFAVIGLGNFGSNLAVKLAELGCEVLAIDRSSATIEKIKDYVSEAVTVDAMDRRALETLGVPDVDCAVVSLGDRVDTSILLTLYLKEMGVKEIVVKAVSEDHERILKMIGATDVVFPERDTAVKTAYTLANPNILDKTYLAEGFSIVEITPPKSFVGKTLAELGIRTRFNIEVVAIKSMQNGSGQRPRVTIVPSASYRLKQDDVMVVIASEEGLDRFHQQVGE